MAGRKVYRDVYFRKAALKCLLNVQPELVA